MVQTQVTKVQKLDRMREEPLKKDTPHFRTSGQTESRLMNDPNPTSVQKLDRKVKRSTGASLPRIGQSHSAVGRATEMSAQNPRTRKARHRNPEGQQCQGRSIYCTQITISQHLRNMGHLCSLEETGESPFQSSLGAEFPPATIRTLRAKNQSERFEQRKSLESGRGVRRSRWCFAQPREEKKTTKKTTTSICLSPLEKMRHNFQ